MVSRRDVLKSLSMAGITAPLIKIEELDFSKASVLVIHYAERVTYEQAAEFKRVLSKRIGKDITVITMFGGRTLEALSDEDMNAHGWYRK